MISRSYTHDIARAHERTAASTRPVALSSADYAGTLALRSVVTTGWGPKSLVRALMWALTLWTSTHALAWEATIERDALGVPHIFGETDADMAFGLAWA